MKPRHEMTKEHYKRILDKAGKAMERRKVAKGKAEKEQSSWWWAKWMHATGIRKLES